MPEPRCPFCDGAIISATFAETARLRALCDVAPLVPGHSLVVPIRHVCHLRDLSAAESAEMLAFAARVAGALMRVYAGTAFDLSLQEGAAAGQTVSHLHLHVLPRHAGDLQDRNWHRQLLDSPRRRRLSSEEMANEAVRLRRAMAGVE